MPKHDQAYILSFVLKDGGVYAVHPTDDLKSHATYEYIDFEFTLPDSYQIFIWRRDEDKFTTKEAEDVRKYVEDDLEEFISEGDPKTQTKFLKVVKKLSEDKKCLILAWDKMISPWKDDDVDLEEFIEYVRDVTDNELGDIAEGSSEHDKKLAVYEGRFSEIESDREPLR